MKNESAFTKQLHKSRAKLVTNNRAENIREIILTILDVRW